MYWQTKLVIVLMVLMAVKVMVLVALVIVTMVTVILVLLARREGKAASTFTRNNSLLILLRDLILPSFSPEYAIKCKIFVLFFFFLTVFVGYCILSRFCWLIDLLF